MRRKGAGGAGSAEGVVGGSGGSGGSGEKSGGGVRRDGRIPVEMGVRNITGGVAEGDGTGERPRRRKPAAAAAAAPFAVIGHPSRQSRSRFDLV